MPEEAITREIFWNTPLWLKVVFYVLSVGAIAVFAYGVWRR